MVMLNFEHGGNIYDFKKNIIDFSANINPLGLPAGIREILYKNFDGILHYPDPQAKEITASIARYWKISKENILVGNGSIELIYLITYAFKPKFSIIVVPTFSEYERASRIVNSKIRFLKLKEKEDFSHDLSCTVNTDILFLANPNNPTGNLLLKEPAAVKHLSHKLIVVDEAFMDFLPDEKNHTLIRQAVKNKNIIVLRTFTKFFALPGLRIGYLIAHKDIIRKLKQHQFPWSTNVLAQQAAVRILDEKDYIRKTRLFVEKQRRFLFNALSSIRGLRPFNSRTNFILIKIEKKDISAPLLTKRLILKGILIRDCSNFRGLSNKFIRVAVRSRSQNLKLIRALKGIV